MLGNKVENREEGTADGMYEYFRLFPSQIRPFSFLNCSHVFLTFYLCNIGLLH